jgi:UTP-glucose-1-phosphate uridylyltransferase
MKPALVVLAAGMGSRYGGLKQIDPVGPSNEIIIDYSIHDALKSGFGKVVFIIRKNIEKAFRENIGSRFENLIKVEYAYQELADLPSGFSVPEGRVKPWGTGHALLAVKDIVKEPFAVINSDDFYGREGFKKITDYLTADNRTEYDYCMTGFILKNTLSENGTVSRGVCKTDDSDGLVNVIEMTDIKRVGDAVVCNNYGKKETMTGNEYVSLNMWGMFPSVFEELEKMFVDFLKENINELKSEFYLPFGIDEMIKSKTANVKVLRSNDHWFGITYKNDKPDVIEKINKLVKNGVYPSNLFENK